MAGVIFFNKRLYSQILLQ